VQALERGGNICFHARPQARWFDDVHLRTEPKDDEARVCFVVELHA
jgi:hypothetical protein